MNLIPFYSHQKENYIRGTHTELTIFTASMVVSIVQLSGEQSNTAHIDMAFQTHSPNDLSSICTVVVYRLALEANRSKNNKKSN